MPFVHSIMLPIHDEDSENVRHTVVGHPDHVQEKKVFRSARGEGARVTNRAPSKSSSVQSVVVGKEQTWKVAHSREKRNRAAKESSFFCTCDFDRCNVWIVYLVLFRLLDFPRRCVERVSGRGGRTAVDLSGGLQLNGLIVSRNHTCHGR